MNPRTLRLTRAGLLALLLAAPAAARAQTLRGTVTDRATQGPVAGATVILVTPDSQQVASGISDDNGAFTVTAAPGEYMVTVQRIGYAYFIDGPIRLRANGFASVNLSLTPQAIAVDTLGVRVEQQDPALRRAGFYQRKKDGHGIFLDRGFIEKRESSRMSDILSGLQGVRVISDNGTTDVQLRNSMTNVFRGTPQACLPLIFVDGLLLADGKVAGFSRMNLEQIRPNDTAGIEVYMGESSVPLQFARGGGACGALLFWTRSGPQRR